MKLQGLILVSCLALGNAYAGTASTTFTVSATVQANCTITATALAFGNYDPTASASTIVPSTVTVTCTKGAGSFIGLDNGKYADTGTQRKMQSADNSKLNYNLYQPTTSVAGAACPTSTASAVAWGNTSTTGLNIGVAPDNTARTYNVCGNIPAGQNVPAGNQYTDTVTATVNF